MNNKSLAIIVYKFFEAYMMTKWCVNFIQAP